MDTEGRSGGQEPGTEKAASLQPARWVVIFYEEYDHSVTIEPWRVFCGPGAESAALAACAAKEAERERLINRWCEVFQECKGIKGPLFIQRCREEGVPVEGVGGRYEAHPLPADEEALVDGEVAEVRVTGLSVFVSDPSEELRRAIEAGAKILAREVPGVPHLDELLTEPLFPGLIYRKEGR
jgi:hypothetical protein